MRQIVQSDMSLPFSDWGEGITYIPDPSLGLIPFPATGIEETENLNEFVGQGKGNSLGMLVKHADLVAGGMIEPIPHGAGMQGDSVVRIEMDGSEATYAVIDADPSEAGYWRLTLNLARMINPQ